MNWRMFRGREARASRVGLAVRLGVLALVPMWLTGCVSVAAWKSTGEYDWVPQKPEQFLATTTTGRTDYIVLFRQRGLDTSTRLVALNLSNPAASPVVGSGAIRRMTNACERVELLPMFCRSELPAGWGTVKEAYGVRGPGIEVAVYHDGAAAGPALLPYTTQHARYAQRAILVPLGVMVDVVLFCAAAMGSYGGGINSF